MVQQLASQREWKAPCPETPTNRPTPTLYRATVRIEVESGGLPVHLCLCVLTDPAASHLRKRSDLIASPLVVAALWPTPAHTCATLIVAFPLQIIRAEHTP